MKCAICGSKTSWNESYGRETFIVCPVCHNRIQKVIKESISYEYDFMTALDVILEIGYIREEKGEKQ